MNGRELYEATMRDRGGPFRPWEQLSDWGRDRWELDARAQASQKEGTSGETDADKDSRPVADPCEGVAAAVPRDSSASGAAAFGVICDKPVALLGGGSLPCMRTIGHVGLCDPSSPFLREARKARKQ